VGDAVRRSLPVKVLKLVGAALPIALLLVVTTAMVFVGVVWLIGLEPDMNFRSE
jgi:hypothetical protein